MAFPDLDFEGREVERLEEEKASSLGALEALEVEERDLVGILLRELSEEWEGKERRERPITN